MITNTSELNARTVIKRLSGQGWIIRELTGKNGAEVCHGKTLFKLFYELPVFPTSVEAIAKVEKLSEPEVMAWLKTGEFPREADEPCFDEDCFVPDLPTG